MNSKVLDKKQVFFFFKYVKVRGLVFSIITSYSKLWRNAWFEHLGKNTSVLAEVWLWKSKTEAVGVSENHKSFIWRFDGNCVTACFITEVTTVKLKEVELNLAITFCWLTECAILLLLWSTRWWGFFSWEPHSLYILHSNVYVISIIVARKVECYWWLYCWRWYLFHNVQVCFTVSQESGPLNQVVSPFLLTATPASGVQIFF